MKWESTRKFSFQICHLTVWRDLLLTGRDPGTYVGSDSLLTILRSPGKLIRAFLPELLGALISTALLAVAAAFLSGWSQTLAAAAGLFGITSGTLGAAAKNHAQNLGAQVRIVLGQDAVNQAVLKAGPQGVRRRRQRLRRPGPNSPFDPAPALSGGVGARAAFPGGERDR